MALFLAVGLLALVVIVVGARVLGSQAAHEEALVDAQGITSLLARSVVEPAIPRGLAAGEPGAVDRFDRVMTDRLLVGDVRRVKIWSADGTIVYSDEVRLIGRQFALGVDELGVLTNGGSNAELSELDEPEDQFEGGGGGLVEVYAQVVTPEGELLLFEAYFSLDRIKDRRAEVIEPFQKITLGALSLLMVVATALLWVLTRRVRRTAADRERLLRGAASASGAERRRIARDLHDGVVQDLAGSAFTIAAVAREVDGTARTSLLDSAHSLRRSLRALRSLLVEIHPPDLGASALPAALEDLCAPAAAAGVRVDVRVGGLGVLPQADAELVWRVAQEVIRNTLRHAGATQMTVDLRRVGDSLVLSVTDDGTGFDPESVSTAHYGLRGLESLVRDSRGGSHHRVRAGGRHHDTSGDADVMIRVVLVDDHPVLRSGLTRLLASESDIEVVGTAGDGDEALDVVRRTRPDVVLMDLQMPGTDGVTATRMIVAEGGSEVLVLTSFSDADRIVAALDAGAVGYLLKDAEPEAVIDGVRAVSRGESPLHPRAARLLLVARRPAPSEVDLTPRETQVLVLVRRGLANKQIARRLGVSERRSRPT